MQAEIIAGAIAASATVETNTITIDPDRLLDLKPGESYGAPDESIRPRFSDQSGARRAGAAAADLADQDARPHLWRRRRHDPRQPQPVRPWRRAAIRTAAALDGKAGHRRARHDLDPHLAQSRRPAAVSRTRPGERQRLSGNRAGAGRRQKQHGAGQRPRRGNRLGRCAGAALPRRAWRADAFDAGRRHRPDGDRRTAGDPESRRRRFCGHDRAVAAAGEHDRGTGAAAWPTAPSASDAASRPASKFPISPAAATRSGICPARCAT